MSRTAISNRMPAVVVEYYCYGKRKSKHFGDAYEARRFYAAKLHQGKNPSVKKADGVLTLEDWTKFKQLKET